MIRKSLFLLMFGVSCLGCSDDVEEVAPPLQESEPVFDESYFNDGGYILPDTHTNIVRRVLVTSVTEDGVVEGFDLDGRDSAAGDTETCGHGDLVAPDGSPGIDNQLGRMWPVLKPLVGTAVEGLLQGAINEGSMLMVLEIAGIDDLQNDDDVTFNLFNAILDPNIGTLGLISPDQTFYYNYERPSSTVENLQIVDGELIAGPVRLEIPINILEEDFNMVMDDGWVHITINEDGTFEGIMAGAFHVPTILGVLLESNAAQEARLVLPVFEANADMGYEDGKCNLFSTAVSFEGTTAFVVRDPTKE
jgi:hypothetical protein